MSLACGHWGLLNKTRQIGGIATTTLNLLPGMAWRLPL